MHSNEDTRGCTEVLPVARSQKGAAGCSPACILAGFERSLAGSARNLVGSARSRAVGRGTADRTEVAEVRTRAERRLAEHRDRQE